MARARREGGLMAYGASIVQAHGAGVEIREQLGDPRVECREGEEGLVAQAGEDPPGDHQNARLHFGLVSWFSWPRGQDDGAVVLREVVVRALHAGLIAAGDDDPALELI